MKAIILLEGAAIGPDSNALKVRCQQGFHKLLERMGLKGRQPKLVACGSRGKAFDQFKNYHARCNGGWYVAMLIDSGEPVVNVEKTWAHLKNRKGDEWTKPEGASDEQVLFMTTCMETWIFADRKALEAHYGKSLQASALPSPTRDLEQRHRHEIHDKLVQATRNCPNAYEKVKRSFEVLGKLDPSVLEALPSFARVVRILRQKL